MKRVKGPVKGFFVNIFAVKLAIDDDGQIVVISKKRIRTFWDHNPDNVNSNAETFSLDICRRFPVSIEAHLTTRDGLRQSRRLLFRIVNKPTADGRRPATITMKRYLSDGTAEKETIHLLREVESAKT